MVVAAGFVEIYAHCPRRDAEAVPDDFDTVERYGPFDRIQRGRSFILERDNMQRTNNNLAWMRQRLFANGSCIVEYENGEEIMAAASLIDITIANATLYLEAVLACDIYSHLTKIPISMIFQIEVWLTEQSEFAAAIQESMDNIDFRAIPAIEEAINTLERMKPDESPKEGDVMEPCSICLEEMNVHGMEVWAMPCKHLFHYACITRWLNISNLCPLCRFALPTGYYSR